ncbi:F-box domain-containing protein [Xylariales sp. PMI_506]|nr:F-box domain-containing protein [Xylariales sp. PMI_506]
MLLSKDFNIAHGSHVVPRGDIFPNGAIEDYGSVIESSVDSIPVHPLGIKPLGNQYFVSGPSARHSLGVVGFLPDEMILHLLEYLDTESLKSLGGACRFLFAFCQLDELWKALYLELRATNHEILPWKGTWRKTLLRLPEDITAKVNCNDVFSDVLHRPFACSHIIIRNYAASIPEANQIAKLSSLTHEEFAETWSNQPFILKDYIKSWPVCRDWNIAKLHESYPDVILRAEAVDWPFSVYHSYMCNSSDESPLYLFDRKFAEKMNLKIGHDQDCTYWSPDFFGEDLFTVLGEERPAHRWLIVGPERSGSTFHKDPNGTHAWNAVLEGSKYWLMFPPSVPQPPGVFVSEDSSEVTSPLSIAEYLLTFHEQARKEAGCYEGICKAGEILFVPSGWWHLVVNLEAGIALTQNFVTDSPKHLSHVLSFLKDKPDQVTGFSRDIESPYELFVERLREKHPSLLEQAFEEMERKNRSRKRRWEEAVGPTEDTSGATGGFSFGFGGDDLEDDEVP